MGLHYRYLDFNQMENMGRYFLAADYNTQTIMMKLIKKTLNRMTHSRMTLSRITVEWHSVE